MRIVIEYETTNDALVLRDENDVAVEILGEVGRAIYKNRLTLNDSVLVIRDHNGNMVGEATWEDES